MKWKLEQIRCFLKHIVFKKPKKGYMPGGMQPMFVCPWYNSLVCKKRKSVWKYCRKCDTIGVNLYKHRPELMPNRKAQIEFEGDQQR